MFRRCALAYLVLAVSIIACQSLPAFSVQSIISVPSSEVLPEGTMLLRDSNNIPTDGVARTSPGFILGVGKDIELSGRVTTFVSGDEKLIGDFAAKKVFHIGGASRITVGGRISPLLNRNGEPGSFLFTHLSHRIKETRTSLTAGVYSANKNDCIPNNIGAMIGFEQVIIPNKLRLVADYMSGSENYEVFSAGFKYRPVSTVSLTSAVLVYPKDSDRVAFQFSVSKFISLKEFFKKKERV